MDMQKIAVLYHKDCLDGFSGAWAAHRRFPDARFFPMGYDDRFPYDLDRGYSVFIIDFSFDRETMIRLHNVFGVNNVVLLDHHETAAEKLAGVANCIIDLNRSGAVIAWEYFHPEEPVPTLLKYVQDRDLWKWEMPESRAVDAYIASWSGDDSFEQWRWLDRVITDNFDQVVSEGAAILRSNQRLVRQACETSEVITIGGYDVLGVRSPVLHSEIGEYLLADCVEVPFVVVYTEQAQEIRYSLRSRAGGFNVAQLAREFGGGGHPAAAGFTYRRQP